MINQVFIPTVPKCGRKDVDGSWEVQRLLVDRGYNPGLMVFTHGGIKTVSDEELIRKQYDNLGHLTQSYGESPVVTMLSNIPIGEMDWYHNIEQAKEHVVKGIEFAKGLPLGRRRIVTFHTNTLMPKEEFDAESSRSWKKLFGERISPEFKKIGEYSKVNNVEVLVETCPAPEFGDIDPKAEKNKDDFYRGVPFAELRNPFYLTSVGSVVKFSDIEQTGLGVCLDVCHNYITYQTAREGDLEGFLHEADVSNLRAGSLMNDVRALNPQIDLVHLADVRGRYSRKDGTIFYEGLVLGEGENKQLAQILFHINRTKTPFVLETKDKDFSVRDETKKSIVWILERE